MLRRGPFGSGLCRRGVFGIVKDFENAFGHVREDGVPVFLVIHGDRFAVAGQHLTRFQPGNGLPRAGPQEYEVEGHTVALAAYQQIRDFFLHAKIRVQIIGRDQADRYRCLGHDPLDFLIPFVGGFDLPIVPNRDSILLLQDTQMRPQAVLPLLVLVAVTDEDSGLVHGQRKPPRVRHPAEDRECAYAGSHEFP